MYFFIQMIVIFEPNILQIKNVFKINKHNIKIVLSMHIVVNKNINLQKLF